MRRVALWSLPRSRRLYSRSSRSNKMWVYRRLQRRILWACPVRSSLPSAYCASTDLFVLNFMVWFNLKLIEIHVLVVFCTLAQNAAISSKSRLGPLWIKLTAPVSQTTLPICTHWLFQGLNWKHLIQCRWVRVEATSQSMKMLNVKWSRKLRVLSTMTAETSTPLEVHSTPTTQSMIMVWTRLILTAKLNITKLLSTTPTSQTQTTVKTIVQLTAITVNTESMKMDQTARQNTEAKAEITGDQYLS